MLGRIAGILGRELIVEHFVPLLPSLALDTMFHVRKAYVMSCRELCPVLGEDDAEEHLVRQSLVNLAAIFESLYLSNCVLT